MSIKDPEYLRDIFAYFGEVTFKRMFGGLSIYHQGLIFAIVFEEGLWLKGDNDIHETLLAEGAKQWVYTHKNTLKTTAMPYYTIPESALDDPDEMAVLARRALAASQRIASAKKIPKKRMIKIKPKV